MQGPNALRSGRFRFVPAREEDRRNNRSLQELICVLAGYGISNYRQNQIEKYSARSAEFERQELERRRRNAMLMDAYGDKTSLEDLEKAMAAYEAQARLS